MTDRPAAAEQERERQPTVGTRALRGIPWTLASFGGSRLISLAATLIVARLVAPSEIGVVATALIVVYSLNLLADNGLSISLVVRETIDQPLVDTVFTCMVAMAVLLAGVAAAFAGPIAAAFGEPRLADALPVLAITVVFSTIVWLISNLMQREMQFRHRFYGQLVLAATYTAIAIPMAVADFGLWALVVGQVGSTAASALTLYLLYPRRLRFRWDPPRARIAFRESRAFVSQSITAFFSENLHMVAVSGILGARAMALYSTSYRLAVMPSQALSGPVSEATFPAYAALRDDTGARTRALLTALTFVLVPALAPLAALGVLAPAFVDAVLGPQWHGMALILSILCVWGALSVAAETVGWFTNATGGASFMARVNLVRLFFFAPLIFAAAALFDSLTIVGLLLVGDIAYESAMLFWNAHAKLHVSFAQVARAVAAPFAGAAALAVVALLVRLGCERAGLGPWPELIGGGVLGVAAYAGVLVLVDRSLLVRAKALARRAKGGA